jgi:hypothetical protein
MKRKVSALCFYTQAQQPGKVPDRFYGTDELSAASETSAEVELKYETV